MKKNIFKKKKKSHNHNTKQTSKQRRYTLEPEAWVQILILSLQAALGLSLHRVVPRVVWVSDGMENTRERGWRTVGVTSIIKDTSIINDTSIKVSKQLPLLRCFRDPGNAAGEQGWWGAPWRSPKALPARTDHQQEKSELSGADRTLHI